MKTLIDLHNHPFVHAATKVRPSDDLVIVNYLGTTFEGHEHGVIHYQRHNPNLLVAATWETVFRKAVTYQINKVYGSFRYCYCDRCRREIVELTLSFPNDIKHRQRDILDKWLINFKEGRR